MLKTLKKFFAFCGVDNRRLFITSIWLGVVSAICSAMRIPAAAIVIQALLERNVTMATLWTSLGIIVISLIITIAINMKATMLQTRAGYRACANKRIEIAEHLRYLPMGWFNDNSLGEVTSVTTNTMENMANVATRVVMVTTRGFLTSGIIAAMMFLFDWRMGAACLLAAVISVAAMFSMMGGKNAKLMAEYQAAQDRMTKAGTEYVRGIPVVKIFQQTVYSFKAFQQAIEAYSSKSEYYQDKVCRVPQSLNLTFTEGAFVFLVPVVLFLAPSALAGGDFAGFVTNFAFYAVFSAILSTALARIMFASAGMMLASTALGRIDQVMCAPTLKKPPRPQKPQDSRVEFADVSFTYDGAASPALSHLSFTVEPGQTVALVGPSGGGKTTAASLIPRFWDATSGVVKVGGVDVTQIDPHVLMDQIAFVFQNSRLFKTSILENVRAARPEATRAQVEAALMAAQCGDILEKLPQGMDTQIGSAGTYLSGGEQQRVALARAILKDAPIVVLDEATAFADPENEALIQKALSELTRGRTVIMIAHRLSTVVGADQILVLDKGRIVEQGSHSVLSTAGGLYARMWADYNQAVQWKITSEREVE